MHVQNATKVASKFLRKAEKLDKTGTSAEVVACYRQGLERAPQNADLRNALGHALYWGTGVPMDFVETAEWAAEGPHTCSEYRRIVALDTENPLCLKFDDHAQTLFEQWVTDLERRIRDDSLSPCMISHLSKYRSLMPSLPLLFALADGQMDCVPLSQARLACDWCDYLETHAGRVYASQARPEFYAAFRRHV